VEDCPVKKKIKIIFTIIILLSVAIITITALDGNVATARSSQEQIDRLRAEQRAFERQKREVEARIDTLEFEHMAEMSKKDVLDQRIVMTGLEIRNANEIIDHYYMLIRAKEYEVVLAQAREEAQLENYRTRVRAMEENGIISYLEIIFDSTSFSDLLARVDFVSDIMRSDENAYIKLQNARAETEEAKVDLEDAIAELAVEKAYLEIRKAEFDKQLEQSYAIIREMAEDIETETQKRDHLAAEEARVQRLINAEVERQRRQQEEERQRLSNNQNQNQNQSPNQSQPATSGTANTGAVVATGNNRYPAITANCREMLARLVNLEAGNEGADGKQAVAEVVLNRMVSSRWNHANTVEQIIFDDRWGIQFTVRDLIWTERGAPSSSDFSAVDRALGGPNILSRDYLFFATRPITQNDVIWIGNHAFSK